jgi:hypothetical protein
VKEAIHAAVERAGARRRRQVIRDLVMGSRHQEGIKGPDTCGVLPVLSGVEHLMVTVKALVRRTP